MIQYAVLLAIIICAGDYWMPAFAGMTAVFIDRPSRSSPAMTSISYTRIGIST
jgi:hypothetical protein